MTLTDIVAQALSRNAQLWVDGRDLCTRAPQGSLPQDLREALRREKTSIIAWLGEGCKVAPASFTQQRLWFLEQLQPGTGTYNIQHALLVSGVPDADRLQHAIEAIVKRHGALRTRFLALNGIVGQVVEPDAAVPLEQVEWRDLAPGDKALEERLGQIAARPFDIGALPLLRARLIYLKDGSTLLLFVVHHIVFDGWSTQTLLRELALHYSDNGRHNGHGLPALSLEFSDFAAQQRHLLETDGQESLDYWRRRLEPPLPVLQLPTDFSRPAHFCNHGRRISRNVPGDLAAALKELARREGATLFMLLMAAFKAMLYRNTGQSDVIVGTPVAGREESGTEGLIGFFANTLAVRTRVDGTSLLSELLRDVRTAALEAQAHQRVPFEKIVEILQPPRSMAHAPVFQVMFALQNMPRERLQLDELEVKRLPLDLHRARYDLTLTAIERGDGLTCNLEYNADLYLPETAAALLDQYATLLRSIKTDAGATIDSLEIVPPCDVAILKLVNTTDAELVVQSTFDLLRETAASASASAPAVVTPDDEITYEELWARAHAIAARIQQANLAPESIVGVCVDHGVELIAAMLGIWRAGCAYLPLDPALPPARAQFMVRDAGARIVLAQRKHSALLSGFDGIIVWLDGPVNGHDGGLSPVAVSGDRLAYVIYTSGSTGVPKGAMIEHRGLCNFVHAERAILELRADDRVLLFASIGFDASIFEMLMALGVGATIVTAPRDELLDPARLVEFIDEHDITAAILPPAMLALMPERPLPRLRVLISGGEACSAAVVDRWAPGRAFFNAYGPTEATIWSTWHRCHAGPPTAPPIGRPILNMRVYVSDRRGALVPAGVPGELHVAGVGVGRGYMNQPELTQRHFMAAPKEWCEDAPVYRTGDLVRMRRDGALEFLGRLDNQVKLRGYRIELGEIEAALQSHESVRQAAAFLTPESSEDARIEAVIVAAGPAPSPQDLRAHLQLALPAYMIPNRVHVMDQLPLTAAGKVNRKALAVAVYQHHAAQEPVVDAPRDAAEAAMQQIWRDVFRTSEIGIRDDFFTLGGHSLLAVRLMAEVERVFEKRLPLAHLFETPTIEALARRIREQGASPKPVSLVPLRPNGGRAPFFCVHPAPGTVFCYQPLSRRLNGGHPFYGLQARGADGGDEALDTIDAMAAAYLEEILEVQPRGPFYLGGHSAGALVAYDMAVKLVERGEQVAFLGLIDAIAPQTTPGCEMLHRHVMDATQDTLWLAGFTGLISQFFDREVQVSYRSMAKMPAEEQFNEIVQTLQDAQFMPPGTGAEYVRNLVTITRTNYRACWTYVPRPFSGPIAVFRRSDRFRIIPEGGKASIVAALMKALARHPVDVLKGLPAGLANLRRMRNSRESADAGWQQLTTAPVTAYTVPGNHISMLREPHVRGLAAALHDAMESANDIGRHCSYQDRSGRKDILDAIAAESAVPRPAR